MLIWLPRDIHTKLKVVAVKSEGEKTMQSMIVEAVREYLEKEKK